MPTVERSEMNLQELAVEHADDTLTMHEDLRKRRQKWHSIGSRAAIPKR
jgi:hypothetical protein